VPANTTATKGPRIPKAVTLDLWELALLFMLLGVAGLWVWTHAPATRLPDREAEFFRARYGPDHSTEDAEEWIIRHFFKDRRDGFFVEIGANHYKTWSKTWYLETALGWSGIAVEPLRAFEADYVKYRPRTRFVPLFVGDRSDETAQLFVISAATPVASSSSDFVKQFGTPDRVETVPTITMNDLLDRAKVTTIDFLSIDIELHEPKALAGFDIARFKPTLVCVEALLPVRQQILNYFAQNGYVLNGRYLRADRENLYFMPLSLALARQPNDDGSQDPGIGAVEGIP
jgi:FkbM family methyltransferase